jgi:hypothetical protein
MDLSIKKDKINLEKKHLETQIKDIKVEINKYSLLIKTNNQDHIDFMNFIEYMNIFEIYKWDAIKKDYIEAKKNVTIIKKNVKKIIQSYGDIAQYYICDGTNNMNETIQNLNQDLELLIFNFNNLKKNHSDTHNKSKYLMKNSSVAKIDEINNKNKKLIDKLYHLYEEIKDAKKQMTNMKSKKLDFLRTINNHKH